MRYRDENGQDWADIIDFLTMYLDARRDRGDCLNLERAGQRSDRAADNRRRPRDGRRGLLRRYAASARAVTEPHHPRCNTDDVRRRSGEP